MDVIAEFFARTNAHDVDGLFELIAPTATYGEPLVGGVVDRDGWREGVATTQSLFPDRTMQILRRRPGVDGEAIDARLTMTPPGAEEQSFYDGTWVFDVEDGLITRCRGYY